MFTGPLAGTASTSQRHFLSSCLDRTHPVFEFRPSYNDTSVSKESRIYSPRSKESSVLMQWAEAGSLDGFLSARLGHSRQQATTSQPDEPKDDTRSARIRAFKAAKAGGDQGGRSQANSSGWKTVHYLSPEEISSLMKDIVEGLSFLVRNL
jgi:hypothetical protein